MLQSYELIRYIIHLSITKDLRFILRPFYRNYDQTRIESKHSPCQKITLSLKGDSFDK